MVVSIAFPLALVVLGVLIRYGTSLDLILLASFGIIGKQEVVLDFVVRYFDFATTFNALKVGAALSILLGVLHVIRFFKGISQSSSPNDGFPAKPMFFPCRTSHTRMFPTKRTFSYSYLLAGIPVGWKGSAGGMLSADIETKPAPWYRIWFSLKTPSAWFTVNGDDYFERGHLKGGLEAKLRNYLVSQVCISPQRQIQFAYIYQGVDLSEFAYGYLFTAAKFLNYSSNPVSFWNLYNSNKELTATILEVNNTFDEKHSYFLRPTPNKSTSIQGPKFSESWPKAFYVSPFNSRLGSYSLSASDPLFPSMSSPGSINTTITLSSSSGSPKLIARVFSTEPGIDPSSMSVLQKVGFLTKWWWVGFATFPRTLVQAFILLFRKKLPWAVRPEPKKETRSRIADDNEIFIEGIFRRYLRYFVQNCPLPMTLRYTAAGVTDTTEEVMTSASAQLVPADQVKELEFRVLTPLFYSRYTHYPSCLHAFVQESQLQNSTIQLSDPGLVSELAMSYTSSKAAALEFSSSWEKLCFDAIHWLRTDAGKIQNCETKDVDGEMDKNLACLPEIKDKRRISEIERFMLKACSPKQRFEYVRRVGKMYLADHIAFGWAEILDLEVFAVKVAVMWGVVKILL
jgi:hypothetical protein